MDRVKQQNSLGNNGLQDIELLGFLSFHTTGRKIMQRFSRSQHLVGGKYVNMCPLTSLPFFFSTMQIRRGELFVNLKYEQKCPTFAFIYK
jgi:hypothetical protein